MISAERPLPALPCVTRLRFGDRSSLDPPVARKLAPEGESCFTQRVLQLPAAEDAGSEGMLEAPSGYRVVHHRGELGTLAPYVAHRVDDAAVLAVKLPEPGGPGRVVPLDQHNAVRPHMPP